MSWNFDEEVNRENSDCIKYDMRRETFGNEGVIPLWVADMDFPVPDFPRTATFSPLNSVKSIPFSTSNSPNDLYKPLIEIT